MNWTKSSYSTANADCLELGTNGSAVVAIRNSKHVERGSLALPATAVADFVDACRAGELDDLAG